MSDTETSAGLEKNVVQAHIRFTPHIHQARFILSEFQTVVAVAGARSGKTLVGAARALDMAVRQPNYSDKDRRAGIPYMIAIGTENYPMLKRVILPAFQRMCPQELKAGTYHWTDHLQRVWGTKGLTYCYFLSCRDPTSWMGLDLYGCWLDEFTLVKEEMYNEIQSRLANQKGWLQLTGTPRGPNWAKKRLYDPWIKGSKQIDFHTWTTRENPFFPRDVLKQKKEEMPDRYFRRTFEASWDTFEGQVYEDFLEEVHCKERNGFTFVLPGGRLVGKGRMVVQLEHVAAGVDWGYTAPGAIVVGGRTRNIGRKRGTWYILDVVAGRGVEVVSVSNGDSWVRRALEMKAKWGVQMFYSDPSEPEHIQQFKVAGLPVRAAENDVQPGIQCVAMYMKVDEATEQTRMVVMDDMRDIKDEITYYHWKNNKEEPEKINDHSMDAMRYLMYTHEKHGAFDRELNYQPQRE